MKQVKRIWIPQAIAVVMLMVALNPSNPYEYYILLKWICCAIYSYLALQAYRQDKEAWMWILAVIAGIYNPIIKLSLTREFMLVINSITIGITIVSIFEIQKDSKMN